ncbi:hypothetical protein SUGI_0575080 [Cryptomeria japonica]|nr:hypothetical protein SUGI_0575080 [Cryptomeria japonica]
MKKPTKCLEILGEEANSIGIRDPTNKFTHLQFDADPRDNDDTISMNACSKAGHAFERAHGMDIWGYGKDHPELNSIINDCMESFTMTTMKQIVSCYRGFEELETVVNVGGGNGAALWVIVIICEGISACLGN